MKLITLNTWGGRRGASLLDFFRRQAEVDIFLLQEVFHEGTGRTVFHDEEMPWLFKEIGLTLPTHRGHFAPAEAGEWGLAAFIKKTVPIAAQGETFVFRHRDAMIGWDARTVGRNLQYFQIILGNSPLTLINFHGLWNGRDKNDSPDRLEQSQKIIDFIKTLSGDFILVGDFNLRPDTQSLKMLESELGLKNLVEEHRVTSTRTSFYTKPERFADYVLTSAGVKVQDFKVLPDEVSDHSPLLLEFTL